MIKYTKSHEGGREKKMEKNFGPISRKGIEGNEMKKLLTYFF